MTENQYPPRRMIIADFAILLLIIAGLSVFPHHADLVLLVAYVAVVLYGFITKRHLPLIHLLISTIIAVVWVSIAHNNYGYNHEYISIFGLNILPLIAWSLGLLGMSDLYNHLRFRNTWVKFLVFIPVFWLLLIAIETYAFHVIEIRDIESGNSAGLPFCNCIHAPWWMRVVYFTLGPAYYGITLIVDKYLSRNKQIKA